MQSPVVYNVFTRYTLGQQKCQAKKHLTFDVKCFITCVHVIKQSEFTVLHPGTVAKPPDEADLLPYPVSIRPLPLRQGNASQPPRP